VTGYTPPLDDMRFCLHALGLAEAASALPGCEEAGADLVDAILEEGGKFAADVLAPLNAVGDAEGASLENGVVRTAPGFAGAYADFVSGGWGSLPHDPDHGGQGLPWLLFAATQEMWIGANTAWSLCQVLTAGAVELLGLFGSDAQKATYLDKLVSGQWSGTMNLTEPQAGSDLGQLRCRAEPEDDHYRLTGQKIFITYGEHDMAENIVHFVLARTPDAPAGVKGISLFIVPKFLVNADSSLGDRNDLKCLSLEEKLGIHGSPTCVMSYGEAGNGAVGYLIGEKNQGLAAMFTMMNCARLVIGLSGLAIAERAYQQARAYARERDQFGPIVDHPDIRRMLMTMKSEIAAMRAVAYDAALALDTAKRMPPGDHQAKAQARVDLLIPMVKAWCTDLGVEISSLALQVHGGAGFIEETGIAQHYRDARIAPIYEGTNGIQALDLVGRKLLRDKGAAMMDFIAEARATLFGLSEADDTVVKAAEAALDDLEAASRWILENAAADDTPARAAATPYLRLFGTAAGAVMMARRDSAAQGGSEFEKAQRACAQFYAAHIAPQTGSLLATVTAGPESIMALTAEQF
jgi:alkylation response protein AidB-like acyl-CoA dehydrogenase